jgi:hypothetical protein
VSTNIINLMYQQCLIWSGFACAPFLFALGLLGFLVQFLVQYSALMVRSKAPKSAAVGSLYYRFLLATWCFALRHAQPLPGHQRAHPVLWRLQPGKQV